VPLVSTADPGMLGRIQDRAKTSIITGHSAHQAVEKPFGRYFQAVPDETGRLLSLALFWLVLILACTGTALCPFSEC
jgi:hypothetical protein